MDTLEQRWQRLETGMTVVGPENDRPRPAVALFHGCGGLRPHLDAYAEAAKAEGWRAYIIDSYAPRGWSRQFALATVCSGLQFRGDARGGDVLAAIDGLSKRPEVEASRLCLAGWSHGGWGIMEAMSTDPTPGALGVADPEACDLSGVKGAWLAYPYLGFLAMHRNRPWRMAPKTLAVISRTDHLTTVRNAEAVYGRLREAGLPVETWIAEGTHAFDEPSNVPPMRHDPVLAEDAIRRFRGLLVGL